MTKKHKDDTMFKAEWRNLRKNPMLVISLAVILLIPIMYAGFFLGSIWDPYGNTDNLPVAVVNNDEGVEMVNKSVNIGDELVKKLKDNKDIGWQFVSEAEAKEGIEKGDYYMQIVVPSDFSKNVASVTDPQPKTSTLTYTLTPSRNFVASLLTNQAAQNVNQEITSTVNKAYVGTLLEAVKSTSDGMNKAASGASSLATGGQQLQNGVSLYANGVNQLAQGQSSLTNGLKTLDDGTKSLKSGVQTLTTQLPTANQIDQLTSGVSQIEQGLATLQNSVSAPNPAVDSLQQAVMNDSTALQKSLQDFQAKATEGQPAIARLTIAAQSADSEVEVSTNDLQTALDLIKSSQAVAKQSSELLIDLSQLTTALATQKSQLSAGVTSLNTGMSNLAPNLNTALNGYTKISTGSSQLQAGAGQLQTGSDSAYRGSQQLLSGVAQLDGQSANLQNGVGQLASGSTILSQSLASASDQLASQPTGAATLDHIVKPVALKEESIGNVPNYGYALSPYVISLALFVGALVFNVIYPVRKVYSKPENAKRWWLSKMSVAFAVSIGQALIMIAIMVWGLGLRPEQPALFVLLTMITSMTFMSIVTLLVIAFDNVGRFLAMLLLVLQLGSSEGVFPIILSPKFFQALNPFMPMTYSIHGFRETISAGLGSAVFWKNILILVSIMIVTNLLLVLFLKIHGNNKFKNELLNED